MTIAGAGLAARLVYAGTVAHHVKLGFDAAAYQILGLGLADHLRYTNPGTLFASTHPPTANFPPGYPLFLAGLDKLGWSSTFDFRVAGAVLGALTVILTGYLGRRLTRRSSAGLLAAVFVALSPTLIASSASSMSECVSVPVMVLVLLAVTWAARSPRLAAWAVVGLLAGCLGLIRSEDLLVALLLVPVACVVSPDTSWRRRAVGVSLALVASLVVVAPWFVRNYEDFHPHVVVSTASDKTVAGANCATTYSGPLLGYWDYRCLGHDRLANTNEARYGQLLSAEGRHYAENHLSRLPLVASVRVLRAWGLYAPTQESQLDALETRNAAWQEFAWPFSLVTLAVALPGLVLIRRDHLSLVLLGGPVVLVTVVVVFTYGNDRFVLSAVPSLCVAAALTLVRVADAAREWHRRSVRPPRHAASTSRWM